MRNSSPIRSSTRRLNDGGWLTKPDALRVIFTEYTKYLAALARGVVPLRPPGEDPVTHAWLGRCQSVSVGDDRQRDCVWPRLRYQQ